VKEFIEEIKLHWKVILVVLIMSLIWLYGTVVQVKVLSEFAIENPPITIKIDTTKTK
tara:strand:- start:401 stop:571 length:171 start_codon:yes stop_codon:yes gene_type:complete